MCKRLRSGDVFLGLYCTNLIRFVKSGIELSIRQDVFDVQHIDTCKHAIHTIYAIAIHDMYNTYNTPNTQNIHTLPTTQYTKYIQYHTHNTQYMHNTQYTIQYIHTIHTFMQNTQHTCLLQLLLFQKCLRSWNRGDKGPLSHDSS